MEQCETRVEQVRAHPGRCAGIISWVRGTLLEGLWHTQMVLPDLQSCSNASPQMCPDLFPCSRLFHQKSCSWPFWTLFGHISGQNDWNKSGAHWNKSILTKKTKNIIGCHGKPTSKKPPSLRHVNNLPIYKLGQNIDEKAQFLDFES